MPEPNTEELLLEVAQRPSHISGDAGSVTQQPIAQMIELDRYLESKRAAKSKGLGVAVKKLVPPGTD